MSDKNVDLEFSAHHAFLQSPSSGTLKAKICVIVGNFSAISWRE